MELSELLDRKKYLEFLRDLGSGKYPVKEVLDILGEGTFTPETLSRSLEYIGKKLLGKHYTVLYPVEMIVVPRYPFSKQPMIAWKDLQGKEYSDPEVVRIKYITGRLGNLINSGFLLKNFVLVDIDNKNNVKSEYADIETRRGYHKLFYIPRYACAEIKFNNVKGNKISLYCNSINIEVMSGSRFLGSHPLQSRYLEVSGGKINVRSYRTISRRAEIGFGSADLTPLVGSIDDFKAYLEGLLRELGCEGYTNKIIIIPKEREDTTEGLPQVSPRESRFNTSKIYILGGLPYKEFKALVSDKQPLLPTCLRQALFSVVDKGHRYFHLRLLLGIIPFFVPLTDETISEFIEDWKMRTGSTAGEVRQWIYNSKYFTGKITMDDKELHVPSILGVPVEAWSDFESLGYCNNCCLRDSCLRFEGSKRRKLIVNYIESLIGDGQ